MRAASGRLPLDFTFPLDNKVQFYAFDRQDSLAEIAITTWPNCNLKTNIITNLLLKIHDIASLQHCSMNGCMVN